MYVRIGARRPAGWLARLITAFPKAGTLSYFVIS